MRSTLALSVLTGALLASSVPLSALAQAECRAGVEEVTRLSASDVNAALQAHKRLQAKFDAGACTNQLEVEAAARPLVAAMVRSVAPILAKPAPTSGELQRASQVLLAAREVNNLGWEVAHGLARIARFEKRWDDAVVELNYAIIRLHGELQDGVARAQGAPPPRLAELYRQYQAIRKEVQLAALQAKQFHAPPPTRDNKPGSLFADPFAGTKFAARQDATAIPVTFRYNSPDFDDKGQGWATLLAEHIDAAKPDSVVLTGHTDNVGSQEFNCGLAKRRLETLAAFLKSKTAHQPKYVLIAQGKMDRIDVSGSPDLTPAEIEQYNRRVALASDAPAARHCR